MRKQIIERIVKLLDGRSPALDEDERTRIAAGALLVECARVDSSYTDADRRLVCEALTQLFDLDAEVTEALVAVAEKRTEEVWHDWILTQAVKRGFDPEERRRLVARLWRIAHTNGVLEHREERFIRRIAHELDLSEDDVEASRPRDEGEETAG